MSHLGPHPRRVTFRTLGLGLSALVAAAALATSPAPTTGWDRSYAETTLWQLMNGARVNNGLAPLQSHGTLVSLARWRSQDMLDRSYFSHTIPGCGCDVYVYYTSNGVAWDWAGENIAWNSGRTDEYSPVRAHEQFMGSPGHRANVLDHRFTHGGVGAAQKTGLFLGHNQDTRMYTQLFLQPKSAPAPAPAPPAPAPPPGSGGGGGGGGGGAAPVQPTAATPAPTPEPEPEPKLVTMSAPSRPTSSAGLDGVATRISPSAWSVDRGAHLAAEERAADRAAALATTDPARRNASTVDPAAAAAAADATTVALEVRAADEPEPGLLESIVGAVIGFLFG
ncbi:MAG TPA: CAP domain-containing protein [Candidatus Angelobacter sp.]|nr:CAP domain-containing protein [Candidatus Angelobacter sp.]